MRVLLIADVHANWEALLALQRAEPQPDALLFAGDAVGYGPDPALCARWLIANATVAVRGNHDAALADGELVGSPPELDEAARETLAYSRNLLAPGAVGALRQWTASDHILLGGARFYVTHGTPADPMSGQVNPATCLETNLDSLFGDISADVIILGHTHLPAIRQFGDRLIVNPGSLGQPRYGVPDATYAVWEDGRIQVKHLHYDHATTASKLRMVPLSPEATDRLTGILETGLLA